MDAEELKDKLEYELDRRLISARTLLSGFRVIDEGSRRSFAYLDDRYVPFYYHLGKYIQPKFLLKIGFNLGLLSGSFLKSCKTVEWLQGFQEKSDEYFSPRLGMANIRDIYPNPKPLFVHVGDLLDEQWSLRDKKWDLVIVNVETTHDKLRFYLDVIWPHVSEGGWIVVDYVNYHKPTGETYRDFCKVQNREPTVVNTRYGVGLLER